MIEEHILVVTQLNLVLYNTIKWPYQPKHSPSNIIGTSGHMYTSTNVFNNWLLKT